MKKKPTTTKTLRWNKLNGKWGRAWGQRIKAGAERSGMSLNTSWKQSCYRMTDTQWFEVSSHCECFGGLGWQYFTSITVQFILLKLFFGRDTKERVCLSIWQRQRAERATIVVSYCKVMHSPKVIWHTKSHDVGRIDPSRLKNQFQLRSQLFQTAIACWAKSVFSPFRSLSLSPLFFLYLHDFGHLSGNHWKTKNFQRNVNNQNIKWKTKNVSEKIRVKNSRWNFLRHLMGWKEKPCSLVLFWNVLDETRMWE